MRNQSSYANDQQLLAASKEGDSEAFRLLFEKYWQDLFTIAYKRLHSSEDAKDILQDVFLSLWNNIENITVEDSLGGYLYTALRNKIFNHFEKQQVRLQNLMRQKVNPVEAEETIWSSFCTKELQQFIALQVSHMPEKMRQIYLLSKEERLTNAEIAALLDLSTQTVKNQLHNALGRLRKSLADSHFSFFLIIPSLLTLR